MERRRVNRSRALASSTLILGLLAEAAACHDAPARSADVESMSLTASAAPAPSPVPAAARNVPSAVDVARARLAGYVVDDQHVACRVLYSWTTTTQVEELKTKPVLLSRTERPGVGRSFFHQVLEVNAPRMVPPAMALSGPAFAKVRFAWPHAWPTSIGPDGEAYGDQLLRIVLKPTAVFARYDTQTGWTFVDMQNQSVPEADALAHSERIAAVYFINRGNVVDLQSHPRAPYREYVLVNESQIEEWSVGTKEIEEEIAAATEAMRAVWTASEDKVAAIGLATLFQASLAFDDEFPATELRARAAALLDTLESAKAALASSLSHAPEVAFVPNPPLPKPPPVPRQQAGTRFRGTF